MIPEFQNNAQIEQDLLDGPEKVSQTLLEWRKATLERERIEALLHMRFSTENPDKKAGDINAMVKSNDERFNAALKESEAEAAYNLAYEKLMSAKKISGLRTAF